MNTSLLGQIHGNEDSKPIFFGPEIWPTQNYGGISRYFQNLILGTIEINKNTYFYMPKKIEKDSKLYASKQIIEVETERGKELTKVGLSRLTGNGNGGIYHSTFYGAVNYRLWHKYGFRNVITIHDLISEKFANKSVLSRPRVDQKKRAIKFADHIICISNTTKNELLKFYEIPEEKLSVIYLGCNFLETQKDLDFSKPKGDYLLYVGKRGWYKNFTRFIQAYSKSRFLKENLNIVAFGGSEFTQAENELFADLKIQEKVLFMTGGDDKLASLYSNATALVYPSLDEGFGLPPLEAMSLGCPVIASNTGSIPEICKENAVFFDPYNLESIRDTLETSLIDTKLITRNVASGKKHALNFTWASTIENTNNLYSKLLV